MSAQAGIQLFLQDISGFPSPSTRGQARRGNDNLEKKNFTEP
jgi:hypothetical protein